MELDYETLKAMRATQYHRNLSEKQKAYARLLEGKEARRSQREQLKAAEWPPARVRSQVVTPARPPHGAGRAAARTLLAHGGVEAVTDMPTMVAGCSGLQGGAATRKARVAPQLKSTTADAVLRSIEDVNELKTLLELPVKQLLDDNKFDVEAELSIMRDIVASEKFEWTAAAADEAAAHKVEDLDDQMKAIKSERREKNTEAEFHSLRDVLLFLGRPQEALLGGDWEEEDWELLPRPMSSNNSQKRSTEDETMIEEEEESWAILA